MAINESVDQTEERKIANFTHKIDAAKGDHYHTVANPSRGEKRGERGLNKGYRPGREGVDSR